MTITKILSSPAGLEILVDAEWHRLPPPRETFQRNHVVILPSSLPGTPQVYLQAPEREDSPQSVVPNAVTNQALAELLGRWNRGELEDGEREVEIELTS